MIIINPPFLETSILKKHTFSCFFQHFSQANTGILPQLAADVQPALRAKVTTWCPAIAVSMQSAVYVVVALVGYAALGQAVDLDLFKIYEAGSSLSFFFEF